MNSKEREKKRIELGKKFREARQAGRMTQQEVADAANIHVNYYSRIERGLENPSYEVLLDIKDVLKIKSLDLL
jgi:transcriptional regulator with XRE-family HTH domain